MKLLVSAACACLIAWPVLGAELTDGLCSVSGQTAELIMTKRQQNVEMSNLMATIDKAEGIDVLRPVFRSYVVAAYQQPAYGLESDQQKAIKKFRDDMELACLKDMK